MTDFIQYLKATYAELAHISWPTPRQAGVYTVLVIVISAAVAVLIGIFDRGLTLGLDWFIQ